ncbi:hypothetical protein [Roseivirga sp. E12]|uniref:hypothetical protein n=1 Tax=Roseivirga sp. E12 TaxID=2819237 RepID=UPI001ABCC2EA|nr:hypothetical protein [Roseivirga sp. E12]MBO3699452.1 hypothetical protein [Roseivirga sp. E12]
MNRVILNIVLILLVIGLGSAGCAKSTVPQKTEVADLTFSEDLSQYNPKVEVTNTNSGEASNEVVQNEALESQFDISDQLDALLDSMRVGNDSVRMMDGYTILVYSGNNGTEAGRVRNRLFDIVPDMTARYSYKLPTYFVKVGQFFQQVEAQPLYRKIRAYYPTASIVPDKFPIEEK